MSRTTTQVVSPSNARKKGQDSKRSLLCRPWILKYVRLYLFLTGKTKTEYLRVCVPHITKYQLGSNLSVLIILADFLSIFLTYYTECLLFGTRSQEIFAAASIQKVAQTFENVSK
jgi:hypothetical protein